MQAQLCSVAFIKGQSVQAPGFSPRVSSIAPEFTSGSGGLRAGAAVPAARAAAQRRQSPRRPRRGPSASPAKLASSGLAASRGEGGRGAGAAVPAAHAAAQRRQHQRFFSSRRARARAPQRTCTCTTETEHCRYSHFFLTFQMSLILEMSLIPEMSLKKNVTGSRRDPAGGDGEDQT